MATALTAQLAAEPEFRNILFSYKGVTDPARAGTIKIDATGLKLKSHVRYFYRFISGEGDASPTGQFTTAPAPRASRAYQQAGIADIVPNAKLSDREGFANGRCVQMQRMTASAPVNAAGLRVPVASRRSSAIS